MSNGVLKRCFLETVLTKSLRVCTFLNKVGMTKIFFYKCSKVNVVSRNATKNDQKILVFKIMALELGSTNSHILEQDTCHWQSVCHQTTLRFKISLTRYIRKQVLSEWWKIIMKVLSWRFYKCLGSSNMLTVKRCSETVFFREWSNQVFHRLEFPK